VIAMSNYTDEEARAIFDQARATLARPLPAWQPRSETNAERWRREASEREAQAAREREHASSDAVMARLQRYTADAIAAERSYMLEEFLPEVLAQLREMTSDEIKASIERMAAGMKLEIEALRHETTKHKRMRRAANVIDLPNPLAAKSSSS
jgi:hypothetical protein